METLKNIAVFTIGAGLGIAVGMLTAPNSGRKTREQIGSEFDEVKGKLESMSHDKLEEARKLYNETVKEQAKNGKKLVDSLKDSVSLS